MGVSTLIYSTLGVVINCMRIGPIPVVIMIVIVRIAVVMTVMVVPVIVSVVM